jgi:hypothetical protein
MSDELHEDVIFTHLSWDYRLYGLRVRDMILYGLPTAVLGFFVLVPLGRLAYLPLLVIGVVVFMALLQWRQGERYLQVQLMRLASPKHLSPFARPRKALRPFPVGQEQLDGRRWPR